MQILLIAIATAASLLAGAALAGEKETVSLGSLSLSYDTAQWRAEQTEEGYVQMLPIGRRSGRQDPVFLMQLRNVRGKSCADLALREIGGAVYEEPQGRVINIGGAEALRLIAPNRCPNAMPKAEVICMLEGKGAYLVKASRPGCHSGANTLNSGVDPLAGLLSGLHLSP